MLSLSPAVAKRCADALETPLTPIITKDTPRHLADIPPSVRALPTDLQVVALCDLLADVREQRNDRNATVCDLRQRLRLTELAYGRVLRDFDSFAQLVRIRNESLFNSVCATLSR